MAQRKGQNLYKEVDAIHRAELSEVHKKQKQAALIKDAMKDPDTAQAVKDFIFSGDPDAVSPLDKYRQDV
jgi:hypothetical protein